MNSYPISNAASTIALTTSTAAISRARDAECRVIIAQYDSRTADVHAMQEYANCVERIHPKKLEPAETLALKGLFVMALIGAVLGGIWASKDRWADIVDIFFGAMLGFIMLPMGCVASVALIKGFIWLFS